MRRLMRVEESSHIRSRGLVLVGPLDDPAGARYRFGDTVEVRMPSGQVLRATITGIPISPSRPGHADILLGDLQGEIEPGAEVWRLTPEGA